ncbi:MAG: insulinase family protein [Bdellovibrionaceae bacterium]|nr:insulinase family protein [Pseudobdellovibrionaceae bacterium]
MTAFRPKPAPPVFRKTRIPKSGIRVVTEMHAQARALSVGIWVETGTRDERREDAGICHFVEHMVFKRTKNRTAFQIAREMEAVGGEINAYTTREYTCFYTHSLHDHLELSLDVLADLVCRASFDSTDLEKEKQVVLQEIHMAEDNLEDFIYDLYFDRAFGGGPMGWPILGNEASILAMRRAKAVDFYHRSYSADRLIVSVAGAIEHEDVVRLVEKVLRPKLRKGAPRRRKKALFKPFRAVVEKPSEQAHILMGWPAADFQNRLRFEAYIVSTLLAGGMTSKLYQSVREKRGLVYSIYSQLTTFTDNGLMTIYAGTETKHAKKVIELTLKEIAKLRERGVSAADLELYKTQVVGQILLGSDDIENRMNSLGVNEMVFGEYRSVNEVIAEVKAITVKSVNEYIRKYLDTDQMGVLLLGAVPKNIFEPFLRDLD